MKNWNGKENINTIQQLKFSIDLNRKKQKMFNLFLYVEQRKSFKKTHSHMDIC